MNSKIIPPTVDVLLKAIHKECLGCCGLKEEKIEVCDNYHCPFFIYRLVAKSS